MAFPLGAMLDAVDIFFDYMFTGAVSADADGHALGQITVVYGTYYYYHLDGSTTTEQGRISLNTSVVFLDSLKANMPGVRLYWEGNPTSNAGFGANSNALYIGRPGNTITHLVIGTQDNNIDNRDLAVYWGTVPTIRENEVVNWRSYPYYLMGSPRCISNTDNNTLQMTRTYSGVGSADSTIVFPLDPDEEYSYDEAVPIVLQVIHDNGYPDITADDLPSFEDINPPEPTEPTEPLSTSFLTKPELEDVLSSESYNLEPFPTSQIFDFSSLQIPTETIPVQYLEFFPSIFSISWDYFSSLGLATPLLVFGFLFLLIRILRGR